MAIGYRGYEHQKGSLGSKDHQGSTPQSQRHKVVNLIKTASIIIYLAERLLGGYSKSSNVTIVVLLSWPVDRVDIVQ